MVMCFPLDCARFPPAETLTSVVWVKYSSVGCTTPVRGINRRNKFRDGKSEYSRLLERPVFTCQFYLSALISLCRRQILHYTNYTTQPPMKKRASAVNKTQHVYCVTLYWKRQARDVYKSEWMWTTLLSLVWADQQSHFPTRKFSVA